MGDEGGALLQQQWDEQQDQDDERHDQSANDHERSDRAIHPEPLSAVGKGREDISKGDPGDKRKQNVVQQPQGRRQHHKGD